MKNINSVIYILVAFIISLLMATVLCASEDISTKELIELESRPGVVQKFILLAPERPSASVILIGGGPGKYGMYTSFGSPMVKNDGNFLVRTRDIFAEEGLAVAVLDACSDRNDTKEGMTIGWRISNEHVTDIKAVTMFMKKKFSLPVWIAGTSSGTFSTVNAAVNLSEDIHGIVLTSSITMRPKAESLKRGILDMHLDQVTLPVLIVAHKEDKCFFSPPDSANSIKDALIKSSNVEIKYFEGGKEPKTKACKPLSPHGFYGIEEDTVNYISNFVKAN